VLCNTSKMYVAIFRVDRSLVYAENGIDSFIWKDLSFHRSSVSNCLFK